VGNNQRLVVTFTPTDTTDYTTATATVAINVLPATPAITWANPANLVYGTALGATQLDATANVPGTFAYTPAAGTVLRVGNNQRLVVTFTPTDTTDYTTATATTTINVLPATQTPTDGPRITSVRRYGYHMVPTTPVLTFDQALDRATAENINNYVIVAPDGHRIRMSRAVYNPANLTVTLYPNERISIHRPYSLTVKGDGSKGVRSMSGQLLDGKGTGQSGSDFHLVLTWRQLVLGNVSRAFQARYHILPRAKHLTVPFRPERSPNDHRHPGRGSGSEIARSSAGILRRQETVKPTQTSAI
jgi:hypothetical protein